MSHYIVVWKENDGTHEGVQVGCICGESVRRPTTGEAMRWFVSHGCPWDVSNTEELER